MFYVTKVPPKLKGKFYLTAIRLMMLYGKKCREIKCQHEKTQCSRQNGIRNGSIREKWEANIVKNMIESQLGRFGHV